jgi:hypothetical protein
MPEAPYLKPVGALVVPGETAKLDGIPEHRDTIHDMLAILLPAKKTGRRGARIIMTISSQGPTMVHFSVEGSGEWAHPQSSYRAYLKVVLSW